MKGAVRNKEDIILCCESVLEYEMQLLMDC